MITMELKSHMKLFKPLDAYIQKAIDKTESIDRERRGILESFAAYISDKLSSGDEIRLVFICTHNSRRSIMSQIFAQTAAAVYGIENISCYSGGTEATAFNPRAVAAMERAGFKIEHTGENNPLYTVSYSIQADPIRCFSKVYNNDENPDEGFAAIMTCSDAEKNCPFIPGAEQRFSISYKDPKEADDTSFESDRYDERALQIASEMFFTMRTVRAIQLQAS